MSMFDADHPLLEADANVGEMSGIVRLASGRQYDPYGMLEPIIEVSP